MSKQWTQKLVEEAMEHDPGPSYATVPGITALALDNFQIHSNYGAFSSGGNRGERIEMSTWMSLALPAAMAPPGFSIHDMLGDGGIFRTDLRRDDFVGGFSLFNQEILDSKRKRFVMWLDKTAGGTYETCPSRAWQNPHPPTRQFHNPPIYDRTQSSYEDVNVSLDIVRGHRNHKDSDAVGIGGDGLTYGRLVHRLAQNPQYFLCTTPVVLPILGLHPHKSHHLLEGGFRLYGPLVLRMALLVDNKQINDKPDVSEFNPHHYFLEHVIGRAFWQFVVEISRTGCDFHAVPQFIWSVLPPGPGLHFGPRARLIS